MTARIAASWCAGSVLCILLGVGVCAPWIAPRPYASQDRENPQVRPSREYLLGTDELGRDRFSRLIYGTRVSLLLAPAAALMSVAIAAIVGGAAALSGRWVRRGLIAVTDLLLALPTILILLTVRAMLPLNVSAWTSIVITSTLLGALNWPAAARVVRAGTESVIHAGFVLQARAAGVSDFRIYIRQLFPNLRPVLTAQFWILVPAFILTEANLSLLGLGVSEPMPSWGNMLRELENYSAIPERPWVLAPLAVLMIAILCLYTVLPQREET